MSDQEQPGKTEQKDPVGSVKQEEFLRVAQKALNAMKASFNQLDKLIVLSSNLEKERKEYEDTEDLCHCVSSAYRDVVGMSVGLRNVLKTYARAFDESVRKMSEHDQTVEVLGRVAGVLSVIQNPLGGLDSSEDSPKPN